MYLIPDTAWKFGCGRYVQKQGAFMELGKELEKVGTGVLAVAGPRAWQAVKDCYPNALEDIEHVLHIHEGSCSVEAAQAYAQEMDDKGLQVVVGIGGGKIMDLAKLIGEVGRKAVITIPTISATCAAFTPLSVIYTPQGHAKGSWFFENEIACMLVDTSIMARQPARYAYAGIADSMAKMIEINHNIQYTGDSPDMVVARICAQYLYERLTQIAAQLPDAFQKKQPSPLIEELVYLTIPVTGIVSGLARGQGQSALAHGLYESVRTLYTQEAAEYLHGEIVGVGLRYQLAYDGVDLTELDRVMKELGMPMYLRDVNAADDDAACEQIVDEIEKMNLLNHADDNRSRAIEALKAIRQ